MTAENRTALSRAVGLLIFAGYLFLALHRDMRAAIPALVGVTALAVILLAVLFYLGGQDGLQLSPGFIVGIALACRLLFLFRPPELSDDLFRYLWDGLQTLHGNNPYSLAPAASVPFDGWSASILARVNHPEFFTIYPPSAQIISAAGVALIKSHVGLKTVLVALDLATCAVIVKLLRSMNLPTWRAALYAWHPLPVIEIGGSGHIDGAAILFLLVAIALIVLPPGGTGLKETGPGRAGRKRLVRDFGGGMAIAFSIFVKLVPVIYLPLLLCVAFAPLYLAGGCAAALALLSMPFLPGLTHMFVSLGTYLRNWEFANAAFRTLRALLASGDRARTVLAALLVIIIVAAVFSFRRKARGPGYDAPQGLMESLYWVTFAFLLLSPTLHPWYALYLAALLPFAAGPAGLVLSWTVFLAYYVLIRYSLLGEWVENDLIASAIWLSPVLAWLCAFAARLYGRSRAKNLS